MASPTPIKAEQAWVTYALLLVMNFRVVGTPNTVILCAFGLRIQVIPDLRSSHVSQGPAQVGIECNYDRLYMYIRSSVQKFPA